MGKSKIENYDELHRVWNEAACIEDVAEHFRCTVNVCRMTKAKARQFYPHLFFKSFREPYQEEIFISKPCSAPTVACIGTRDKVEALRERASRGEELWHDDDNLEFSGVDTHLIRNGQLDLRTGNNVKLKGAKAS